MVQVPLYKSLVAMEVAKMVGDQVKGGDTLHIPRFGSLSAKVYTPGSAMTATNQDWAYDTLVVSTYKYVNFYVDDARKLTLNVDQARELATEAAYQLKDAIDRHTFANITGADGFMPLDNQDVLGGTNGAPVSAGTANIINIFAGIRKFMREKNVEEAGDWCAVVTPKVASYIETKASVVGYNVADATLRNGYAGDFMGFQIYISNNLPTGALTALAPNVGTNLSGLAGANASATNGRALFFGRKGQINLALMKEPQMYVVQDPTRIGKNYVTWTVYGSNVTYNQARRGCNLSMASAYAG
jgi:hypothetical protein